MPGSLGVALIHGLDQAARDEAARDEAAQDEAAQDEAAAEELPRAEQDVTGSNEV